MRIVVVHTEADARERWVAALRGLLPGADVASWPQAGGSDSREGSAGSTGAPAAADYAVGWNPPADFFDRVSVSKAFFSSGAGVDHLLRHAGLPAGLPVIRLEDAGMGVQMAEYCCHEVLRVYRRQAEYEQQQRERVWRELEPVPRERFSIGILGLGVLGTQVARSLQAFGFPVAGYGRSARGVEGIDCFGGAGALPQFLARCSVLIALAPLTPETEGMLNRDTLAMLPRGAWLINVARGGLLVEPDLLDALDEGQLAGATLDVFRVEPLPPEHAFWGHPKIRMTPHVSAMTLVEESARQVARKIGGLERGEPATGMVDRARGY